MVFLKNAVRDPGYIETMNALADKTPSDSKVMLLFERRGLYCPRPYVIGTPYFQARYNTPPPSNSESLYNLLRANGINYVVLGGTNKNPDELDGEYLEKKELLMKQVSRLVRDKKLSIIFGCDDYFLCRVL